MQLKNKLNLQLYRVVQHAGAHESDGTKMALRSIVYVTLVSHFHVQFIIIVIIAYFRVYIYIYIYIYVAMVS